MSAWATQWGDFGEVEARITVRWAREKACVIDHRVTDSRNSVNHAIGRKSNLVAVGGSRLGEQRRASKKP